MGWYFRRGNQAFGPVGDEELRMLIRRGSVDKRTLVQTEGATEWHPAETLLPDIFDTPPVMDGPSAPVSYEEVFPEGAGDSAESVNFSSGGFGELDAFLTEMTENVDMSFSSDGDGAKQRPAQTAPRPVPAAPRPTPVRQPPPGDDPVREEDSKAVCFGCGRLLRKVELAQVEGASLCAECQQRLAARASRPPEPAPAPGFVEKHLNEWICEAGATLIGLGLFLGFLKGDVQWMLAVVPLAPALAVLAACLCGGLEHSFGRRMLAFLVCAWLGTLTLYLPASTLAPLVLLAGRAVLLWALGYHDIKKKALLNALGVFVVVSVLGGVLVLRGASVPWMVLILALLVADIAVAAVAWGAWQGGAGLSVAALGTLLYVWDGAAAYSLLHPGNVWVSAALTVGATGLAALAVMSVDRETGRPEGASRWPLRRNALPLGATDALMAVLAAAAVAAFTTFVLRATHSEPLVYGHAVVLAALLFLGTSIRLPHPHHVKWLLLAWGLTVLALLVIPIEKGTLYAHTLVALSDAYPVLETWQLVHFLGGVVMVFFARFHIDRFLAEPARPWQRHATIFLAAFGVFALREAFALPVAASYPHLLTQGPYTAAFGLIFAGAGLLTGSALLAFFERK